jgi:hypothetical protein
MVRPNVDLVSLEHKGGFYKGPRNRGVKARKSSKAALQGYGEEPLVQPMQNNRPPTSYIIRLTLALMEN